MTCVSSSAAFSQAGAGADWPLYNGTLDSHRYSTLVQINNENVGRLVPVWSFQTGMVNPSTSFENTPIVANGMMYVSTGVNVIFALKADTGELKWRWHGSMLGLQACTRGNAPRLLSLPKVRTR